MSRRARSPAKARRSRAPPRSNIRTAPTARDGRRSRVAALRKSRPPAHGIAEPGPKFVIAEQRVARRQEPVCQRGLLEPFDTAESRGYPVSGLVHLARDFGVARLVRADERQPPKPVEEDDSAQKEKRDQIEMFRIVSFSD